MTTIKVSQINAALRGLDAVSAGIKRGTYSRYGIDSVLCDVGSIRMVCDDALDAIVAGLPASRPVTLEHDEPLD